MSDIMKWEPFKDSIKRSPLFANILDLQIREENGEIVASGKVPDDVKDILDIVVHQDRVTISGEGSLTKSSPAAKEYQWGKFTRTFHLPVKIKSEKAKVSFENGLLKIRAPKAK